MSIDAFGRVIVGSGHFIQRAPGVVAATEHIVVGGGRFDHIYNTVSQAVDVARNVNDHWTNFVRMTGDDTIPETAKEAYHRELGERLERLGGAGLDIAQAYGWAGAGDLQSAWEKLVDAAVTVGQVYVEGLANPPPTHN